MHGYIRNQAISGKKTWIKKKHLDALNIGIGIHVRFVGSWGRMAQQRASIQRPATATPARPSSISELDKGDGYTRLSHPYVGWAGLQGSAH
jgi:hypothetical protein